MKKKRFLLLTALGVTVALLCGVGVALIHAEETPDSVAPKGTVLLTEGASVSISACTAASGKRAFLSAGTCSAALCRWARKRVRGGRIPDGLRNI